MIAYYTEAPEALTFMQLPNGLADVWLRKDITETTDEEGGKIWETDEVYFRTGLTKEQIETDFDTLFENGGPVIDSDTGEEVADGVTLSERIDALEDAVFELAEVITNG